MELTLLYAYKKYFHHYMPMKNISLYLYFISYKVNIVKIISHKFFILKNEIHLKNFEMKGIHI